MRWLERRYEEDFFLYVDTWDPHEPWDAPDYYTKLYWPGYDGEIIDPVYARWQDAPGFTEERVRKAHATYMGEITMVDTWMGRLLGQIENMGLVDKTAIIFTSDHGFYFGERGGRFGRMVYDRRPDGGLPRIGDPDATWSHSPLYEELVHIPLLVYAPGVEPGTYSNLASVVDVMPTALDIVGQDVPATVQGQSLLPMMRDRSALGRDFVVSTVPFVHPGEPVWSVDNLRRTLRASQVTTITADGWSLLFSVDEGKSEPFDMESDPRQGSNLTSRRPEVAKELHEYLVQFMRETNVPSGLVKPRLDLRI